MTDRTARELAQINIAENRKAFHDYHILDTYEAGVALLGTEVKAIREGRVNLRDSYASIERGEAFLHHVNISPYSHRGYADHEPLRARKLLLHKREILKLTTQVAEKGMTLVPLRMYFKDGRIKVAVGVARGKKAYDKREAIKQRDADREARAVMKTARRTRESCPQYNSPRRKPRVSLLQVGPGDEVITSTDSFFATAGVTVRVDAPPVFVDLDPVTYNIEPAAVRA